MGGREDSREQRREAPIDGLMRPGEASRTSSRVNAQSRQASFEEAAPLAGGRPSLERSRFQRSRVVKSAKRLF